VPVGMLTSRAYAKQAASGLLAAPLPAAEPAGGHEGTTHVSVIDSDGNAAAITHTLCDSSGVVVPGLGFMFNNDMQSFDPVPGRRNSIAPGKSPVNGGAPTIVSTDGAAVLAIGSPAGPRKVTAVVQALVNMIDFGMDIEAALAADRIHQERGPMMVEQTFPAGLTRELQVLGHAVRETGYTARVAAVHRDPTTGRLTGASDPRSGKGKAVVE
jgi:gamma-glutamyltranspeptidase/glutathione hydrolase